MAMILRVFYVPFSLVSRSWSDFYVVLFGSLLATSTAVNDCFCSDPDHMLLSFDPLAYERENLGLRPACKPDFSRNAVLNENLANPLVRYRSVASRTQI